MVWSKEEVDFVLKWVSQNPAERGRYAWSRCVHEGGTVLQEKHRAGVMVKDCYRRYSTKQQGVPTGPRKKKRQRVEEDEVREE